MANNNSELTEMTKTKEKILFETNELVISLNTQVAVLANSNKTLTETIQDYMDKMDRHMEKMDERDADLSQRATILRNDLTKEQTRLDGVIEDVKELKSKSNLLDLISIAFTAAVGTFMYFFGQR